MIGGNVSRVMCDYCDEEFTCMYDCEVHEEHCPYNPDTIEHAVAERMKHFGMSYSQAMTAYENEQKLLDAWIKNVKG